MVRKSITPNPLCLLALGCLTVFGVTANLGCHRGYYRRMADADAKKLVEEKTNDPRWNLPSADIEVDPQSRMFDPFSKDHPPMPPDDAASNEFMQRADGRKGYPHWHANGDTCYVESPEWKGYLPMDSEGRVVIDINTAIELSLIHSDDLQRQHEELYLSALDVSLERFGFDSQLFAGFNSFVEQQGRFFRTKGALVDPDGPGGVPPFRSGTSSFTYSGGLGANGQGLTYRKLGITGANFVAGLANTFLWNFSGPTTQSASSLINFTITQPLLRGAGRERIMESLTIAERTLLGNVRFMERFRQGFYLEIVTGRSAGQGPSRGGGALSLPTPTSTQAGGILGLLQTQQQIRFAEYNVIQQSNSLARLRELFGADQINFLQVQQAEISLYQAQQNLLDTKVNYLSALDRFKITLGLPPDLEVVIQDDYLERFNLISDEVLESQSAIGRLRLEFGTAANELEKQFNKQGPEAEQVPIQLPASLDQDLKNLVPFIEDAINQLSAAKEKFDAQLDIDLKKLELVRPKRIQYLQKLRRQIQTGEIPADIELGVVSDESVVTPEDLRDRLTASQKQLDDIESELYKIQKFLNDFDELKKTEKPEDLITRLRDEVISNTASQLTRFNGELTELSLIQVLARSNSIELSDVDIDADEATAIARCFRLDWMNARSALVDSWRQIEFVADQLEGQIDLVLDGSVGSIDDNPFRIRYETGNLRGGFRFDSPIVRLSERNQYRQALINYQRARRSFYKFEDEINRNLQLTIRTINLNKTSFELQRRSLQASVQNLEQSSLVLEQPPRFQAGGVRSTTLGNTTARDLTGAINQLNSSQSNFLRAWLTYEVLRRNLDYDLGTMQVDATGRWVDPQIIDREIGFRTAALMGLDPSCLECNLPPEIPVSAPSDYGNNGDAAPSKLPATENAPQAPVDDPLPDERRGDLPRDEKPKRADPPIGSNKNQLRIVPTSSPENVRFEQLPSR